jgi:hypothetical protein
MNYNIFISLLFLSVRLFEENYQLKNKKPFILIFKIYDWNYNQLGNIERIHSIKDLSHNIVRKIDNDWAKKFKLGIIGIDGIIRDSNYNMIGKNESDGRIKDSNYIIC